MRLSPFFSQQQQEFYLVEYDIKLCCQYISSEKEYHAYLGEIFILLSARDTFFLVLFFLFKIYRNVEESLIIKQKIFANEMKQIVVSISANEEIILAIKYITYIESQKNKTFIHLINGKIYSQNKFSLWIWRDFCRMSYG